MITNERMAVNTAKRIVAYLNSKGIKAESDFKFKPILKCLRFCWYVKKLLDCGRTDCIHIGINGSFFAITDDCKLMSGNNVMIVDGIESIFLDYIDAEDKDIFFPHCDIPMKSYFDEGGDDGLYLVEPQDFINWLDRQELYS